ncbi:MAG: sodium-dependent bicarbonate transport family permease [Verrucomicrobia bacterium]|nr:sodium-dependent bicarbonate transport family permease [Verrucomicrobiota bacterium]
MNLNDLVAAFLNPAILFFGLGLAATLLRSDLELPPAVAKALSLFLLFAIGLKGGVALHKSGLGLEVFTTLGAAMAASVIVPVWTFLALRRALGAVDAAAVAATYGSVSAVTFITATAFLTDHGIPFSGHMIAAMALMESPAIIIGVVLARRFASGERKTVDWSHLGRDAFLNGSVFLLLGSLLIGALAGPTRGAAIMPFVETLFPGLLALFLLDMGIVAARRLGDLRKAGLTAITFAAVSPLINASLGLGLSALLGLAHGDALLLIVLCASASYIAVPAALRIALPEANPSLYVTLSLAVTFPLNILIGIPLYHWAVGAWLG